MVAPISANGPLKRVAESGSLPNANSQAEFRQQIASLTDLVRQLAGNASVVAGSAGSMDPLVAPFKLYVNPYIGRDTFAAGAYNTFESSGTDEQKIEQKLKRLHVQALTCGYSPFRPFKTINRAAIEAAIITSRSYYTFTDIRAQVDCVLICLSPGRHIIYNNPGNAPEAITVAPWADGFEPTWQHLIRFNPNEGGLLLPRGASFNGDDLRKCVFSPNYVPPPADEAADYSNRSAILRVTPLALGGQFTFTDKIGATSSHHLLDCIQFSTQSQLNTFYSRVFTACGAGADLSSALLVARTSEYKIVGPIEGLPASTWDTTASASPYLFNLSIRSDWGLCGAFLDGDRVEGLRSMVTAQFTGVSLQKDMSCWEIYSGGNWVTPTYAEYIAAQPDNVRMKPTRRSRHLTAIDDAFVQAVSVFCIGQGVGYMTDAGGEITVTNSNSSFGGCAALSKGYKRAAFPQDKEWTVSRIKVPRTLSEKTNNIKRIYLGTVASVSNSPNQIVLNAALGTTGSTTVPDILSSQGFTFKSGTQIWIENPTGPDYRATLSATAWSSTTPTIISLSSAVVDSATSLAINPLTLANGRRVYIRRLLDTRTVAERRVSLQLANTTSARIPQRNFVIQTDPARVGGAIARVLNTTTELLLVTKSGNGPTPGMGVNRTAEVTLRRGAASVSYSVGNFYHKGTVVKAANKHYQNTERGYATTTVPEAPLWIETFVHQPSNFDPEDNASNETPILIFDTDTATTESSTTLGINWSTIFTSSGEVRDQYRAGTDYLGAHAFLVAMGLSAGNAHTALAPRTEATRLLDPASATDFPTAPSGGAATGRGNWAVEFRRPSVLRLYGHAWEWAGWLNYSKAVPAAQQQLSTFNRFTYYFTNEAGGRVVPQGSNEDGFNISPRGLEDIETGEVVTVEDLDAPDIDLPNQNEDVTINNLTVTGSLDIAGVTTIVNDEVNLQGNLQIIQNFSVLGLVTQMLLDPAVIDTNGLLRTIGSLTANTSFGSIGIGQAPETGYELSLNGAAKGNIVDLASGSAIDCRLGNWFSRTINGNVTFTITNPPATGSYVLALRLTYTSGIITLPGSWLWRGGTTPTLVAGRVYIIVGVTDNGGTTWRGSFSEFLG